MLYIEDFKKAHKTSKVISNIEDEISELRVKEKTLKTEKSVKRIRDRIDILEYKASMLYGNLAEVEAFIDACADPYTGQVLYHRFLKGEHWDKVAFSVSQGHAGAECVRKISERYLEKMGVVKRDSVEGKSKKTV